jgi:hypothetical protein
MFSLICGIQTQNDDRIMGHEYKRRTESGWESVGRRRNEKDTKE